MKKIEIIENNINNIEEFVKMTELEVLYKIEQEGLINFLQNYSLPEEFILKWGHSGPEFIGLPKNIIITMMNLSEDFIKKAIDIDYFELEDIYELNMSTYANLSQKFIKIYEKYINWQRMILYLCSSEKIENIEKFEWIVEKFNLWKLISASELPMEFVRKNKDKLDWRIVSIINEFSNEEKEEFSQEIPNFKDEWEEYWKENPTNHQKNMTNFRSSTEGPSIRDIRKIIDSNIKEEKKRFEVKHTMDELTNDDLLQIKEMIQSGRVSNF
jgi:hypothetical protein